MTQYTGQPTGPFIPPSAPAGFQPSAFPWMQAPPGPTPSPFPPSPMMPGPDMQQNAGAAQSAGSEPDAHSGEEGHKCGCSHDQQPQAAPGGVVPPQAGYYTQPYLHEQYQVGPNLLNYGLGYPPFAVPAAADPASNSLNFLGMNLSDSQFWKGALIGAGVLLLLTNESLQKGLLKAGATAFSTAQRGVEELKEKFEDVQAELRMKESGK